MMHVIVGLMAIALGIWGVMDEWYYALDCLKAIGTLGLTIGGFLALLGGVFGRSRRGGAATPVAGEGAVAGESDEAAASTPPMSGERQTS